MTRPAKTATFQVKPEALEECLEVIRTFVREVNTNEPRTIFYAAFQDVADPTRFTHAFAFEDEQAEEFHKTTEWVKRFTEVLYPNTVDGVTFSGFELVAVTGQD